MRLPCAIAILVALAACSPSRRPVATPQPSASARLAVVDAEVRAGCLDCLTEAFSEYDVLRRDPAAADEATAGAIRTAVLIAVRERELGMIDEGYLGRARAIAAAAPNVAGWLTKIIDIADAVPGSRARLPQTEADFARMRALRTNREAWTALVRDAAGYDEAAAYVWLALTCDSTDTRAIQTGELFEAVSTFAGAPLIVYRESLCRTIDARTLESLLAANARFGEIDYSIGLSNLGARPRPNLDEAERRFQQAYAWRPRWPVLTLAMAGIAMTAEDFDRARLLYEETLAVDADSVDAMLGDLRALTYLPRPEGAIAVSDRLLARGWYVGDAHYWRAFNELQLSRLDAAWDDVEAAEKGLVNADVPKLAGLIAYRREHLDVAIERFTTSHDRNPFDCETRFYLGVVHAELRHWPDTADGLASAAECLQNAEQDLQKEIADIRASNLREDRKARQIARREQQIAEGRRRIATCWFDIAVADFSLARKDEARRYAEKVVDDEQFGDRARELLTRLR